MADDWANRAGCRGTDPDIFFGRTRVGLAKRICRFCPVFDECREETDRLEPVDPNRMYGVYAGESPAERFMRRYTVSNVA